MHSVHIHTFLKSNFSSSQASPYLCSCFIKDVVPAESAVCSSLVRGHVHVHKLWRTSAPTTLPPCTCSSTRRLALSMLCRRDDGLGLCHSYRALRRCRKPNWPTYTWPAQVGGRCFAHASGISFALPPTLDRVIRRPQCRLHELVEKNLENDVFHVCVSYVRLCGRVVCSQQCNASRLSPGQCLTLRDFRRGESWINQIINQSNRHLIS